MLNHVTVLETLKWTTNLHECISTQACASLHAHAKHSINLIVIRNSMLIRSSYCHVVMTNYVFWLITGFIRHWIISYLQMVTEFTCIQRGWQSFMLLLLGSLLALSSLTACQVSGSDNWDSYASLQFLCISLCCGPTSKHHPQEFLDCCVHTWLLGIGAYHCLLMDASVTLLWFQDSWL
jgi:hypothetical protein